MDNFKLTPHFTFYEMTRTDNRPYLEKNRVVSQELLCNGVSLCATLLEPIRAHFNKPLIIHSGYRCESLNDAIGGSSSSQHKSFQAADFHVSGVDLEETFQWIRLYSGLKWGQLIGEGTYQGHMTWIHLSLGYPWRSLDKSQQVLRWDATTGYTHLS